ncbi:MAG TPA: HRDC domain-containing protein [bacterium]|nr:HRDC domain-containing protein [bacterium]
MDLHFDLVDRPESLKALADKLASQDIIAFDTEFIRESTYLPKLALIQVATREEAWLVDILALRHEAMAPLLAVLQDPRILKVLHSAHGDQECLFHSYGITATPTLDTFEAAGLLGLGESVSLRDLIRMELGLNVGKSHARTDWLKRPIGEELKKYALSDVQYLVDIGQRLLRRLEKLGRKEWSMELSAYYENSRLYSDNSAEIAEKLAKSGRISARSFAILRELVAWREQRARSLNIPRRRIADDETLFHIANARPTSVDQLSKFRGLNSGEIQRQGKVLIEKIKLHLDKPNEALPPVPQANIPTAVQARVVDLLGAYLRVLSERYEIAARHLFTTHELRKIVLDNMTDPKQWVEKGLCSPRVSELVGEELRAMLQGKRALSIESGKIKIESLE